jgi:pantetheine-phosphate adenylyltransferase
MPTNGRRRAIFPGTFDPVTYGHLDLINRGARLFDQLVIGVGKNPEKSEMFSPDERVEMMREGIADLDNVTVQAYEGLTMKFAHAVSADVIVRGIRDSVDLRDELHFANANLLVGDVETVFLMASDRNALTSSSLIKQIVEMGGSEVERLAELVPPGVLKRLAEKLRPAP